MSQPPSDLKALWRRAPEELPPPDLAAIRKAAQRFQRRKAIANAIEYVAAAVVIVMFAWYLFVLEGIFIRLASGLGILWALYYVWQRWRLITTRPIPEDAAACFDFHRGERQVELLFNGNVAPAPSAPNPTMFPISEDGPFYAAFLTGGNLDTKGGPKTNVAGQVVDDEDKPIPGLYGVGNCVASASARAYWAGGATIGPILAFAYLAAAAAHKERKKRAN